MVVNGNETETKWKWNANKPLKQTFKVFSSLPSTNGVFAASCTCSRLDRCWFAMHQKWKDKKTFGTETEKKSIVFLWNSSRGYY